MVVRGKEVSMRAIVNKIALVSGISFLIYVSLVLLDITCPEGLTSCQLYEPFSPW